jgi:hypothetical protein
VAVAGVEGEVGAAIQTAAEDGFLDEREAGYHVA